MSVQTRTEEQVAALSQEVESLREEARTLQQTLQQATAARDLAISKKWPSTYWRDLITTIVFLFLNILLLRFIVRAFLEQELAKKQTENDKQLETLRQQLAEQQQQQTALLQESIAHLEAQNSQLQQQLSGVSLSEEQNRNVVQALKDEVAQLKAKAARLQKEKDQAEINAESAKHAAREEGREEEERLRGEVRKLSSEVVRLEAQLVGQQEALRQEAIRRQDTEKRLAAATTSGGGRAGELEALVEEYRALLADKAAQVDRLETEVEQWMLASEQLQKLGEEAVAEVLCHTHTHTHTHTS